VFDVSVYWPDEQGKQIFSFVFMVSSNCPAKHCEQSKLLFSAVLPVAQAPHEVLRLRSFDAVFTAQSLQATLPS